MQAPLGGTPGRRARALAARLVGLAAGRRRGRGLGLAVAVALGGARGAGAGGAALPAGVALQQLLQMPDVADGGAERLHLAEPPLGQLAGQVVAQARVPLVDAAHPLPLALVAPAEEGGPEGAVPGRPLPARGVPEGLPRGGAGRGPRQVRGLRAEVARSQRQQCGRLTFLHPSRESQQITQETDLLEDETSDLQSVDAGPFRQPGTAGLSFLISGSRTGFTETLQDFLNSWHYSIVFIKIQTEVISKDLGPPNPHFKPCLPL